MLPIGRATGDDTSAGVDEAAQLARQDAEKEGVYGFRWVKQSSTDDCLRACIASLLCIDPDELPHDASSSWYGTCSEALRPLGWWLCEATPSYVAGIAPEALWLALVPSKHDPGSHVVVMRGKVLIHDPGRRRPNYRDGEEVMVAVTGAVLLVPLDPFRAGIDLTEGASGAGAPE